MNENSVASRPSRPAAKVMLKSAAPSSAWREIEGKGRTACAYIDTTCGGSVVLTALSATNLDLVQGSSYRDCHSGVVDRCIGS